jgi:PPOX class probable F420-dependent enzyme
LDLDEAREYIRSHHRAVLATMRLDGTPQMSPVGATVDEAGRVVVSSRETAVKTRNVRRDPRAWLCVFPDSFYADRFVQVEGTVTVLSLPQAMEPLVDYYRRIAGEHPDWDDYQRAMEQEKRVLLRLDLTRAGPDISG